MLREKKMEVLHSMAATSDVIDQFTLDSGDEEEKNETLIDEGKDIDVAEKDEYSDITED